MPLRPCLGCRRPTKGNRCNGCSRAQTRERDASRGTTTERGYGTEHQALRADYQRRMDRGERFVCWRPDCDTPIDPTRWHLGHDDHDRSITRGPECPECNLRHSGGSRKSEARGG